MNLPICLGSNAHHYTIYSEMDGLVIVAFLGISIEMKTDIASQKSRALGLSDRNKN